MDQKLIRSIENRMLEQENLVRYQEGRRTRNLYLFIITGLVILILVTLLFDFSLEVLLNRKS